MRCGSYYRSDTHLPKFGDIIHCPTKGDLCGSVWVALTAKMAPRGGGSYYPQVTILSLDGSIRTSTCSTAERSEWHIAEAYAPAEEE